MSKADKTTTSSASTSKKGRINLQSVVIALLYALILIANLVFTVGVAIESRYGPGYCLFYVENVRIGDNNMSTFLPFSGMCNTVIYMASAGFVLLLLIAIPRFLYARKAATPSAAIQVILAVLSTVTAIYSLVAVSIAQAGIKQTCDGFMAYTNTLGVNANCAAIFAAGFNTAADPNTRVVKNYSGLMSSISCGWVVFAAWTLLALYEWFKYRIVLRK
ncbi:hypothetical protein BC831DRAFT_459852 [Entophlyctis helioformis]|nr:hypothetical protein BC831DRAFT_459852 [Entophlyctis helioformis]